MNSNGLMGLETPGYSGVIRFGQQQIQVQNGVFRMQGKQFYVSEKGEVTDESDNQVAVVRNGQLAPAQPQVAQRPQGAPA